MIRSILRSFLRLITYPFFILLHLIFVISSIILRTYETFSSTSYQSELESNENENEIIPPNHLALIFIPCKKYKKGEKEALLESIIRSIEWSLQKGIKELSFWDGKGLIQSILPNLIKQINKKYINNQNLPLSPPCTPPNELIEIIPTQDNEEFEFHSPSPKRKVECDLVQKLESLDKEVRTIHIRSNAFMNEIKGLKLHFLSPSSSDDLLVNLTRNYVEKKINVDDITVKSLDRDIEDQLHFTSDPDLLLIHHLTPPSTFQSLLPRRPPELWGYPFWSLRITEIYQFPSPLPLLHHINPLIQSLRSSSLPFLRKLGHIVSLPVKLDPRGILNKEEWDGAMIAWSKVEQRLGK
ncbi:uncharacterized protein I206_100936 [Kwoniella pini CBS 10737]|uniref:ditrans,polycis-polyprenyl diphosphate synthase [(2E,6E)-farnesyldiphosphate specific] n=1 Tax=Kwoniella pini CBS 10737 TaxID=1296096 RepID=A0A1B9IBW9_9TREE|nr:uncharacterized protein I206_00390 [Kwoniella pini CBS 10737]OCF53089.1 hypothetical protein I206_00390 [Kwoniella pini CBS 10737]